MAKTSYNGLTSSDLLVPKPKEDLNRCGVSWKVTVLAIPMMYFAAHITMETLLPQYLVERLTQDALQQLDRTCEYGEVRISGSGLERQDDPVGQDVFLERDKPETHVNLSQLTSRCEEDFLRRQNEATENSLAEAADLSLIISLSALIPTILFLIFCGGYTDTIGRRPFLVATLCGAVIKHTFNTLTIGLRLPIWLLAVFSAVEGITGSWCLIHVTCFSTVADLVEGTAQRTMWIALIGAGVSLTILLEQIVVGIVIDQIGFMIAALINALIMLATLAVAFFCFPESLSPEVGKKNRRLSLSPIANVKRLISYFLLKGTRTQKIAIWTLCVTFLFSQFNISTINTIDALYLTAEPFLWSSFYIGLYCGLRAAGQFVVGTFLVKLHVGWCKSETLCHIGFVFLIAGFTLEALTNSSWQIILVAILLAPGGASFPLLRGFLSSLGSALDQGVIFSVASLLECCLLIFGYIGILQVYAFTLSTSLPGAAYFLLTFSAICGAILFAIFRYVHSKDDYKHFDFEQIAQPPDGQESPDLSKE